MLNSLKKDGKENPKLNIPTFSIAALAPEPRLRRSQMEILVPSSSSQPPQHWAEPVSSLLYLPLGLTSSLIKEVCLLQKTAVWQGHRMILQLALSRLGVSGEETGLEEA